MKKLAQLVSFLFGIPWVVAIVWILLFETGLTGSQIKLFAFIFPFLHIVVPLVYMIHAVKKGEISDFDISKREERYGILTVIFVKNIMSLIAIALFGNAYLLHIGLAVVAAFTAVYVITFYWKISLHMTFNTVGITLLNVVTDWNHVYLFAILPIVFWSRYALKKHTPAQLIAGFAVSEGIMIIVLAYFGIVTL